ncbi:RusA-like crossover junction endodeoxyribonuclease [Vibrio phage 1.031.O._10N.261.46.F8]|nr:RusA-like crossover junction endodeoxyribonuclease [Vibrio phage 1.031.O._10N.261.46.F8]
MKRELNFDIQQCDQWQYYGDGLRFGYHFIKGKESDGETLAEAEDLDALVQIIAEQFPDESGEVWQFFFDEGAYLGFHNGDLADDKWRWESNIDACKIGRYELDADQTIPSVNREYIPVRRGRSVQKTLTGWGREFKEILQSQSEHTEFDGWIDAIRDAGHEKGRRFRLKFEMVVFFNYQFNSRDVTNMIKLTEDALAKHVMHIDDQFNAIVPLTKYCNRDKNDPERIYIRATVLNTVWDEE